MTDQPKKPVFIPAIEQVERAVKFQKSRNSTKNTLQNILSVSIILAAVVILIVSLFMPVMKIEGESMEPTLADGSVVMFVKANEFERGDICCFYWNGSIMTKRIIGEPNDWIEISKDGTVYLNGIALDEPYIDTHSLGECDISVPFQVPENEYFVIGDNRVDSVDSRSSVFGCVSKEKVFGKIWIELWPLDQFKVFD